MGLTLTISDLAMPFKSPKPMILGITLQFLLMPLLAFVISSAFSLPNELLIGMILVGAAPGGTSSNVMTFVAGGNVALSVSMTTFSTLLSIFMTPLLTSFYLNEVIEVNKMGMFISMSKMILLPVLAGIFIHALFPRLVEKIKPALPLIAVAGICTAITIVVALNASKLGFITGMIFFAVIIHNIAGFVSGYGIARGFRFDKITARTIGIEVGMQNSGLATVIALKHFSLLSSLPPALFSVVQNICGMILASYWAKKTAVNKSMPVVCKLDG